MTRKTRMQYRAYQGPVLTDAQAPEQVTESRWHQPFGEPRLAAFTAGRMAVAPIASGVTFNPLSLPNANAQADYYSLKFSEPVRVKPGLNAALQQSFTVDPTALTRPESVTVDRWLLPLAEPVRVPKRLAEASQRFFEFQPTPIIDIGWFAPLSEPKREKPRLGEGLQQYLALHPTPVIKIDWFIPMSEPVRQKVGLRSTYQMDRSHLLASTYKKTFSFGYVSYGKAK